MKVLTKQDKKELATEYLNNVNTPSEYVNLDKLADILASEFNSKDRADTDTLCLEIPERESKTGCPLLIDIPDEWVEEVE